MKSSTIEDRWCAPAGLVVGRDEVGGLCHEVRKPVAAIQAYAELLWDGLSGPLTAQQRDHVAVILQATQRLDEHLCDLHDLAELTLGELALDRGPCRLDRLLESVQDALHLGFQREGVRLYLERGAPWTHAEVDSRRLGQALRRLLAVALGRSDEGQEVWLSIESCSEGARIRVRDEGPRPSNEMLESAFELPRGDRSERWAGLGCELLLCRSIAELHGGRLEVDRAPGGGVAFTLSLPGATADGSERR